MPEYPYKIRYRRQETEAFSTPIYFEAKQWFFEGDISIVFPQEIPAVYRDNLCSKCGRIFQGHGSFYGDDPHIVCPGMWITTTPFELSSSKKYILFQDKFFKRRFEPVRKIVTMGGGMGTGVINVEYILIEFSEVNETYTVPELPLGD